MLAARREAKFLRRLRAQLQNPFGQPTGIKQLARVRDAGHRLDMWVPRILFVEPTQGGFEAARVPGLECFGHWLGLIAEVQYGGKQCYE